MTELKLIPEPESIEVISKNKTALTHISLGENLLSDEAVKDFLGFCRLPDGDENIIFETNASLSEEEYILKTGETTVITASSAAGQLYALQTLKQIFLQTDFIVSELIIKDKPKYKLRGFMLDAGRYFFSVEDVKLFIRRMAYHKLNLFHFHLTEDQGWRIEIKKYPRLTEKGSVRSATNFNNIEYRGFYTQEDIREIVRYAHAFCVKVMPEFDIPGHSRAAIAAYSKLACFERDLPVATHWGVKHDVLCVGREYTMKFVKDVLDEFFELFPDEYIHIGGDEVPKHRWHLCPECQKKIRELGLKDEEELQAWFMNTIKNYCIEHGRQTFMWSWELKDEGILDKDLGFTKCGDLETGDRPFIDTSTDAYYIDLPYGKISLNDTVIHKPYSGNCLGVEATLWTEYVPDIKKADKMTYPRLGAVCETGWAGECDCGKFNKKLSFYYSYLNCCGCGSSTLAVANPSKIRGTLQDLWFEKRQLTWEGLTNIIDDKKIENRAKNTSL